MIRFAAAVAALMLATVVHAAPAPCGKSCTRKNCGHVTARPAPKQRTAVPCTPVPCTQPTALRPTLLEQVRDGFSLVGGFRWQTEKVHVCPTTRVPNPPRGGHEVKDPPYVGAELELPLTQRTLVFGALDRDFDKAPLWQGRVGIKFKPFAGIAAR